MCSLARPLFAILQYEQACLQPACVACTQVRDGADALQKAKNEALHYKAQVTVMGCPPIAGIDGMEWPGVGWLGKGWERQGNCWLDRVWQATRRQSPGGVDDTIGSDPTNRERCCHHVHG